MTFAQSLHTQADLISRIRLRFHFIVLLGIIASAPFCAAAVDLWVQTLIHLALMALVCWLAIAGDGFNTQYPKTFIGLWAIILFALGFSTRYSGAPVRSQQEFWLWVDYALVFFLMGRFSFQDQTRFISVLFWPWGFLCLWALGQFYLHHQTPQASLLNPNLLAGYLIIPLFACLEKLNDQPMDGSKQVRLGLIMFLALSGWTLIQTRSTGAFLGFTFGMLYLGIREPKIFMRNRYRSYWLGTALLILAGSPCWKLFHGGDLHRWLWWQIALQMAAVHPWRGLGPGTFEMAIPHLKNLHAYSLYAHNTFLQWLAENGILFLIGLLVLLGYTLRKSTRPFLAAGVVGVIVHNTIDYNLMIPANALLFWCVLSLSHGSWPTKKRVFSRISRPTRMALLVMGMAGVWLALSRFQADRYQAMAIAAFQSGDYERADRLSAKAAQLSPKAAAPYGLRSRMALREIQITGRQGPLLEALAQELSALEREPAQPLYWLSAMQLYRATGMPQAADLLQQELLSTTPHLKNDKRF